MKYTGVRNEQFLTIKTAYRGGDIEKRVYDSGIKELNRKERLASEKREKEAVKARAETARILRVAKEEKNKVIIELRGNGKKKDTGKCMKKGGGSINDRILEASKRIKYNNVFVQISVDCKVVK